MDKIKINYDALNNARGFEYADNKAGVSCRLVPIEEAREQDKKLKALEIIKETLSIEEDDFYYDEESDKYFFVGSVINKDKYDLLKEVLLWRKNQLTQKN